VSVEVDVTDLVASGVAVTACGEDLAAGHAAADAASTPPRPAGGANPPPRSEHWPTGGQRAPKRC
jgi:hypothetical protein